ncbi:hypothetical protein BD311DRAFT_104252 [Dichomitus squalens]|uniref:Uncharacterized protein n=1 Tax=Dichomitus squalens TaxID=114155 RepID=A0A4Q9MWP9_9APHY|nr:hypothetical protein BD311DRAFT_104252 [Dichomitus squalens]
MSLAKHPSKLNIQMYRQLPRVRSSACRPSSRPTGIGLTHRYWTHKAPVSWTKTLASNTMLSYFIGGVGGVVAVGVSASIPSTILPV